MDIQNVEALVLQIYHIEQATENVTTENAIHQLMSFATSEAAWSVFAQLLNSSHPVVQVYAGNALYDKVLREWRSLVEQNRLEIHAALWHALFEENSRIRHHSVLKRLCQAIVSCAILSHARVAKRDSGSNNLLFLKQGLQSVEGLHLSRHIEVLAHSLTHHQFSSALQLVKDVLQQIFTDLYSADLYDTPTDSTSETQRGECDAMINRLWRFVTCFEILSLLPHELLQLDLPAIVRDDLQSLLRCIVPSVYTALTASLNSSESVISPYNVNKSLQVFGMQIVQRLSVLSTTTDQTSRVVTLSAQCLGTAINSIARWCNLGYPLGTIYTKFPGLLQGLIQCLEIPSALVITHAVDAIELILNLGCHPRELNRDEALCAISEGVLRTRKICGKILPLLYNSGLPSSLSDDAESILHRLCLLISVLGETETSWLCREMQQNHPDIPLGTSLAHYALDLLSLPCYRAIAPVFDFFSAIQTVEVNIRSNMLGLDMYETLLKCLLKRLKYPRGFSITNGWHSVEPLQFSVKKLINDSDAMCTWKPMQGDFHAFRFNACACIEDFWELLDSKNLFFETIAEFMFHHCSNLCDHASHERVQHCDWRSLESGLFILGHVDCAASTKISESFFRTSGTAIDTICSLTPQVSSLPAPLLRTCCRYLNTIAPVLIQVCGSLQEIKNYQESAHVAIKIVRAMLEFAAQCLICQTGEDEDEEHYDEDEDVGATHDGALRDGGVLCSAAAHAICAVLHNCRSIFLAPDEHERSSFQVTSKSLILLYNTAVQAEAPLSVQLKLIEGICKITTFCYIRGVVSLSETTQDMSSLLGTSLASIQSAHVQLHECMDLSNIEQIHSQLCHSAQTIYAFFKFSAEASRNENAETDASDFLLPIAEQLVPMSVQLLRSNPKEEQVVFSYLGVLEQIVAALEFRFLPHLQELVAYLMDLIRTHGAISAIDTLTVTVECFASHSGISTHDKELTSQVFSHLTTMLCEYINSYTRNQAQNPDFVQSVMSFFQQLCQYFPESLLQDVSCLTVSIQLASFGLVAPEQVVVRAASKFLTTLLRSPILTTSDTSTRQTFDKVLHHYGQTLCENIVENLTNGAVFKSVGFGDASVTDVLYRLITCVGSTTATWLLSALKARAAHTRDEVLRNSGNHGMASAAFGGLTDQDFELIVAYLLGAAGLDAGDPAGMGARGRRAGFGRFRMLVRDLADISRGNNDRDALIGYILE